MCNKCVNIDYYRHIKSLSIVIVFVYPTIIIVAYRRKGICNCPWDYIGFCPRLNDSFLDNITACSENVYDVGVTIVFIRMIHSMYDSTI